MAGESSSGEGGFARETAWANDAYRRERGASSSERHGQDPDQWPHSPMAIPTTRQRYGLGLRRLRRGRESLRAQLEIWTFRLLRPRALAQRGTGHNRKLSATGLPSEDSRAVRDLY